jgi:hypothetical protein
MFSLRPSAPAGTRLPYRTTAVTAARHERRAPGDKVAAAGVEEVVQARRRQSAAGTPFRLAGVTGRGELELDPLAGDDRAGERRDAVLEDPQAATQHDPYLCGLRAQVDGADGKALRGCARAGDAAVPRPGRAVVAGRRDDERVQVECSFDGAGIRRVGEGGVRCGQRDDGNARRVVGVAVEIRIDRALEPGDQLVGPRVHGPASGDVVLPPRDPNRHDRSAGRNAVQSIRAAGADEDPRHLGAVPLQPRRIVRFAARQRAQRLADHVDPVQDSPAQVRV